MFLTNKLYDPVLIKLGIGLISSTHPYDEQNNRMMWKKKGLTMGSKSWVRRMLLGLKSLCTMQPTLQSS